MSYRVPKFSYWQDAPMPLNQLVLFASTLEECIPLDHPARLLDEILDELDWTKWEARIRREAQTAAHSSQYSLQSVSFCSG